MSFYINFSPLKNKIKRLIPLRLGNRLQMIDVLISCSLTLLNEASNINTLQNEAMVSYFSKDLKYTLLCQSEVVDCIVVG